MKIIITIEVEKEYIQAGNLAANLEDLAWNIRGNYELNRTINLLNYHDDKTIIGKCTIKE